MSKTIDEKVVEMRFDNRHFEKNTAQTMSTLDKLKQKLNLTGASKGLENLSASVNKMNMNGMTSAIDTVHSKFSALEVMGVTALANITNSAVNAGKRMVKALTIDPVMDGFNEYEMTLNAIQTTMAGTGKTAKEVEEQLKLLDIYADKTVYSTADMLNNLPKFTNAGVELEKATTAMIGIANATALAGGDAGKASIAFYNLGQAIGTGYLTRMDYNSINNAGIATMEWKNQMVEAAIAAGTLKKVGEDQYQAGKKTMTLQQLFIDGLQEQWATTDVMMKVFGDYGDETTEIGKKSYAAAQDIKTFSMMMDSLKATAGTGWKDTWQAVFGGLDEAKVFWTGLTNFISNIITGMADFRNKILDSALGKTFTGVLDQVNTVTDAVKTVTKPLQDYSKLVDEIIGGKWGNAPTRWQDLEAAGYDWAHAQNLVNERLGSSVRHATKYSEAQGEVAKSEVKTTEATKELLLELLKLSDAELKAKGYTDEQIAAFRELEKIADRTGIPLEELIDNLDKFNGRWLLIRSFKNIGEGLVKVFKAIGDAWKETFFGTTDSETIISNIASKLFYLIAAFHKFTTYLKVNDTAAQNLKDTFKGVFAILDLVLTIVGGPIKLGIKLLGQLFKALDIGAEGILEITGGLGRAISGFSEWLNGLLDFTAVFEFLAPFIKSGVSALKEWIKGLGETEAVKKFTEYLNKSKEQFTKWFASFKDMKPEDVVNFFKSIGAAIKNFFMNINDQLGGVPGDIISGLANGLKSGASKAIEGIIYLATSLINKFKELLGIHSPSTVFFAIGGFIIAGLVGGLLAGSGDLGTALGGITTKITEFFNNIDWNKVFSAGMSAGLLLLAKKLTTIVDNITAPLGGVGSVLESVSGVIDESAKGIAKTITNAAKVVKSFSKILNGFAFKTRMEGIKELAISLAILVGAIAVLTLLDTDKMWEGVKVVLALSGILAILAIAMNKISQASLSITKEGGLKANGMKSSLLSIGIALLAMAGVVKMLGGMNPDQIKQGFLGLAGAVIALGALMAAYGLLIKGKAAQNMDKAGQMMKKMGTALLIMAVVAKIVGGMKWEALGKAAAFVGGFTLFVLALVAITNGNTDKQIDKVGSTLLKISAAMMLMAIVIKMVNKLNWGALLKGAAFAAGFSLFVWGMVSILKTNNETQIAKVGGTLLAISAAMLIMVGVIKLIAGMEWTELGKGAAGIVALGVIIGGLLYMVKQIGPEAPKLAGTLLAMAAAIGILAAVTFMLGMMDIKSLGKGLAAVGVLSLFMKGMIKASKDANEAKGTMIGMAIALAVMAAAVAALSFIDWTKLLPATVAMSALMGMMAVMMNQCKNVTGSLGPLIVMTVAIGVLGTLCILLAKLAPDSALTAAASLTLLMGGLVLLLRNIDKMKSNVKETISVVGNLLLLCVPLIALTGMLYLLKDTNNSISSVISLTILMGAMTGLLVLLGKMNTNISKAATGAVGLLALCVPLAAMAGILILMKFADNAITNMIALSGLLIVMTGVLAALSNIGVMVPNAVAGAVGLLALCVPLVAIAGILILMNFADNVITNMLALSGLLIVMTGVLTVLTVIGSLVAPALAGVVGLLALCVPLVAMAGILILMDNVDDAMGNAKALSLLLLTMAGVLTVLAIVGPLAFVGVAAITALTAVIGAIGVFAVAIGALMTTFPQLQEFLNTGLPVLVQIGGAIGEMIGAFVNGVLTQISSGLPEIANNLSLFMTNLTPFITGARLIDEQVLSGVGTLALAILALTAANLISGITSFLPFVGSFADLGTQLSQFMVNAMPFIMLSKQIDPSIMEGIKTLAEAFLIITGANLLDGISRLVGGGSSLETFASQLPILGSGLNSFVSSLGEITPEQVETARNAAGIIKSLAEAANTIPNTGGLLADLVGNNDLGVFAAQLPLVGAGIAGFVRILQQNEISSEAVTTANTAAQIIKTLAEAASSIPNTGGWLADLVGDNDLGTFATQLPNVATGISGFINKLTEGGVTEDSANIANVAAGIIKTLAEAASSIPNTGGWLANLIGDNDLSKFAKELPNVGAGIAGFTDKLGQFGTDKLNTVTISVEALKQIVELAKQDLKTAGSGIKTFGEKLPDFAGKIKEFISAMSDANGESITSAIDKTKQLVDFVKELNTVNVESLKTFAESLGKVGSEGVEKFVESLSGEDPKSKAKTAMTDMIQAGIDGAEEKKSDVETKFGEVGTTAVDAMSTETLISDASAAGVDLVSGFVSGIENNTYLATNAGSALGKAALNAAKAALDEHSPSKEMYKVGDFAGIGFVNALYDNVTSAFKAGAEVGDYAKKGLSNAVSKITNLLDTDMDANPTIRPVLDLSDVESGVGYLSSMFNRGPSLAVATNLGAISYGMNGRNQNGVNDDVVSAINKLGKSLGNSKGDTYNINGMTYDDGSNVADAVKQLYRAAKMERRV